MKKCPFCAEEIQDEARVCKHCGRDLNAPQPKDLSVLKGNLEKAIQKYVSYGYTLMSRLDTSAILERRAQINAIILIGCILLFWPSAIIYAIPSTRKLYRVQLNANADGRVDELGNTAEEFERDKSRSDKTGWIILGIGVALIACIVISSLGRSYR
jgi:hypothetical protein